MEILEKVTKAFNLRQEIKKLEEQAAAIKEQIAAVNAELEPIDADLLKAIKETGQDEIQFDNIYLNYFKKTNVGYSNEASVMTYLKENNLQKFVKTKTTETLDKAGLKKELKTNTKLKAALDPFVSESLTEYITVTSAENHGRMLEHIEAGSKK